MLVVLAAEAELAAEHEQQHQHDDDQQHDGEHAAAAAAAAVSTTVVRSCSTSSRSSAIGNSPCSPVVIGETNELWRARFRMEDEHDESNLLVFAARRWPMRPATRAAHNTSSESSTRRRAGNASSQLPPPRMTAPNATARPTIARRLNEPKGPIDPKSAEAAGQVVQHYGALIEQGRWTEAERFGATPTLPRSSTQTREAREVHLEIGKPGDTEGAAGSIYIDRSRSSSTATDNGADFAAPPT